MTEPSFEDLLEAVLRKDAQVEPLSGLEERVMRRVIVPRSSRLWKSVRLGFFVMSPVCLTIAILISRPNSAKQPEFLAHDPVSRAQLAIPAQGERDKHVVPPSISFVHQKVKYLSGPNQSKYISEERETLPKLDVFPTPTPVLEPVRELARLSFQPGVEISGLDAPLQQGKPPTELTVKPITIAAIEIKPLFPPPDTDKNNIHEHQGDLK